MSTSRLRTNNEDAIAEEENGATACRNSVNVKLWAVDMNTRCHRVRDVFVRATVSRYIGRSTTLGSKSVKPKALLRDNPRLIASQLTMSKPMTGFGLMLS